MICAWRHAHPPSSSFFPVWSSPNLILRASLAFSGLSASSFCPRLRYPQDPGHPSAGPPAALHPPPLSDVDVLHSTHSDDSNDDDDDDSYDTVFPWLLFIIPAVHLRVDLPHKLLLLIVPWKRSQRHRRAQQSLFGFPPGTMCTPTDHLISEPAIDYLLILPSQLGSSSKILCAALSSADEQFASLCWFSFCFEDLLRTLVSHIS